MKRSDSISSPSPSPPCLSARSSRSLYRGREREREREGNPLNGGGSLGPRFELNYTGRDGQTERERETETESKAASRMKGKEGRGCAAMGRAGLGHISSAVEALILLLRTSASAASSGEKTYSVEKTIHLHNYVCSSSWLDY